MSYKKLDSSESLYHFINSKTKNRINDNYIFDLDEKVSYIGLSPISINEIISSINEHLTINENLCEVMHGDFCFSNLLFDFRKHQIQMIDPRGSLDGINFTINGFLSYDLAKLTHSVIGLYDFIVSDRFVIKKDSNGTAEIIFNLQKQTLKVQSEFLSILNEMGFNYKLIMSICIHLFISLIPLHSDSFNRQQGFYFNIFRLYKELKEYDSISNGRQG
jgi:hypothetical protein